MQKVLALWQGRTTAKEIKNSILLPSSKLLAMKIWTAMGKWTQLPPLERLGNKHTLFQNKQDTKQPIAVHTLSFENDMKIDSGSSESNIPGLLRQTEIRKFTRKSELCKDFQLNLSATKRYIHTSKFVGHEIMLHTNTSSRKTLREKKMYTYFQNTFSGIISVPNKYIICFVRWRSHFFPTVPFGF